MDKNGQEIIEILGREISPKELEKHTNPEVLIWTTLASLGFDPLAYDMEQLALGLKR